MWIFATSYKKIEKNSVTTSGKLGLVTRDAQENNLTRYTKYDTRPALPRSCYKIISEECYTNHFLPINPFIRI